MRGMNVTRDELLAGLRAVGIERDDVVYVASSLAALGLMADPVGDVLWALQEAIGPHGTLVVPTFNFGFCRGEPFDRENTPAETGVLAEAVRCLPEAHRTWSPPFHSVAAVGAMAEELVDVESVTSFGRTSVFQRLYETDAKHLLIGCGYHAGVAHFHWLEERHEVPYRFFKKFAGEVILDGERRECDFFMYARKSGVNLNADPLGEEFERAGHVRRTDVGMCRLRAFSLHEFGRFFDRRFAADPLCLLPDRQRSSFQPAWSPVIRIDHIAIVSRYADKIRDLLGHLSYHLRYEALVADLGVNVEVLDGPSAKIEIVNPARAGSVVDGHLGRYPACPLHHIAFEVNDLDGAVEFFRARGYAPLDGRVHAGAEPFQKVLFLSPIQTGGLLVELVHNAADHAESAEGINTCNVMTPVSV